MAKDKIISVKAPVRFDFSGGPSDVAPFKYKETGQAFNTALQMYASVVIESRSDQFIRIRSQDLNKSEKLDLEKEIKLNGSLKLIKAAITYLSPQMGFNMSTFVETPLGSGLGSSAAIAVACIAAIRMFKGEKITGRQLAEDAIYLENVLLGNINGGQDQYAAAIGGFNFFEFAGDNVTVSEVTIPESAVQTLERGSFFCYSGESRLSGNVLQEIMRNYNEDDSITTKAIRNIKTLAFQIKNSLEQNSFPDYEEAIRFALVNQRNLHPQLITPAIERIVEVAHSFGVDSVKVAGAGGGGCVYIFSDGKAVHLRKKLNQMGYLTLPFKLEKNGVSIIE